MTIKASIIIPTTGNRSELVQYAAKSALNQTIKEIEVLIIGDGINEESRSQIFELQKEDNRLYFFDFPKGERRGELHRHKVISKHARGELICYLCDRDLYLPNHIELLYKHLDTYNFIAGNTLFLKENQEVIYWKNPFYGKNAQNEQGVLKEPAFNLSSVGHSLEFYKQLPFGWRTTPPNERFTDQYMWKQFLNHRDCKAITLTEASNLWIKRGHHPGWSVKKRLPELKANYEKIIDKDKLSHLKKQAFDNLIIELNDYKTKTFLLRILGYSLKEVPKKIKERISSYFKKI